MVRPAQPAPQRPFARALYDEARALHESLLKDPRYVRLLALRSLCDEQYR